MAGQVIATPANSVPDGLRLSTHGRCGLPVWVGKRAPNASRPQHQEDRVTLAPCEVPDGDVILDRMALTVLIVEFGRGNLTLHRCPESVRACTWCGTPIRVVTRRSESGRVRPQKVEAEPDPLGRLLLGPDGLVAWDRDYRRSSEVRYNRHRCSAVPTCLEPASRSPQARRWSEAAPRRDGTWYQASGSQGPKTASPGL